MSGHARREPSRARAAIAEVLAVVATLAAATGGGGARAASSVTAPATSRSTATPAAAPTVALLLERAGDAPCHAVCVARGVALTAGHCIDGRGPRASAARGLAVVAPDGRRSVVRAVGLDRDAPVSARAHVGGARPAREDLARLELEDEAVCADVAPLATAAPGTAVRLIRRVARDAPADGRVVRRGSGLLVTTPLVCAGDSGAPLVDGAGRLVGVAVARGFDGCAAAGSVFVDVSAAALQAR